MSLGNCCESKPVFLTIWKQRVGGWRHCARNTEETFIQFINFECLFVIGSSKQITV